MIHLFLKRLGQAAFVCWSVGTLGFALMRLLPGDMAFRIAAGRYGYDQVNLAAAEAVRAELGLDRPAWRLYLEWLFDLLRLDLGDSLVSGLPVLGEILHLLGHTLLLAGAAMLIAILIAVPVGLFAAFRAEGWFDRAALVASAFLRAQPVFVIGLLLLLIFALELRLFPVAGFDGARYLVLPAIALALSMAAVSNRVVRHSAGAVIASAFFAFARVKGLSFAQAFVRHGLRNGALPVLAFLGIQLAGAIEGIVMIESLFSWPGLGHGLAHAVFNRDVPMIQGAAMTLGLIFVGLNLAVDLACHLVDPRGRSDE
ncbi:Binding-protein-dependent transport systems inner membrane component [Azotobacter vinelandii CA]|uniref:Binding-protein-dependent transport systems inner membrane component n=2 Tax=Azotobacter vinelandii TaxID=354 RepID=C1DMJ3_AZOVD|nr:ABC transporter permease [Azotobacter vinelandii]ACO81270.1 Binding-protein-dependent transport systems inner membrane component [Azotobacter vinelandii DJ]AGK14115.1 Binding-protein-dependent transport systems inner membrane component [Azotobacter vinelandii CA]AGK22441.1 Binding-protein-dependent transport systems inner membrane component [Azotobacter vinelandii CA6]SFX28442.1 peptide/nickel transport system permease protein [Azotobacter vinelandii]GLK59285.1 ABC transporter permease [Azo